MIPVNVKTSIPGPKSQEMIAEAMQVIAQAQYSGLFGITLHSGERVFLTDVDGNVFLDFLAGASAVCVGYSRQEVIDAYAQTAQKLQHSCFTYSPNEEAITFAKRIIATTPGNFDKRVLFGMCGSDSVDAAIKIARKFTRKPRIIYFRKSYHGSTGLSIAVNGFEGLQAGLFLGDHYSAVDFPSTPAQAEIALEAIEQLLKKGDVAAVITEPVQGDGGNVVPPFDFHRNLCDLAHRYQAVYIVDETQSGVGRSGHWWEIETFNVAPDILCSGKAISGGYIPLSACVARAEMAATLGKTQHLFTLSGHPPACAVANKIFEIIERDSLMLNAVNRGKQLTEGMQKLVERYPCAKEVRGPGLHVGFETIDPKTNASLGGLFAFRCVEKGLYPGYFGETNNVMRLHPPLIINEEEMHFAIDTISSVVEEYETGRLPESTRLRYKQFAVGLGSDK
jgi:4-aminobutyrate aminotransferase